MAPSRLSVCLIAVVTLLTCNPAFAADAAGDPLKDAGLEKSGDLYILSDEAPILAGVKDLRATKVQADKESRARKVLETQITAKKKIMKDADKEWNELETKLAVITDVSIHNRVVTRMNRLVVDHKQAMADSKDLEVQAAKLSTTAKIKFVDDVAKLAPKAEAVADRYKKLADNADVKAALAKLKATKVALGPSAQFLADAADLKKWVTVYRAAGFCPARDFEKGGSLPVPWMAGNSNSTSNARRKCNSCGAKTSFSARTAITIARNGTSPLNATTI